MPARRFSKDLSDVSPLSRLVRSPFLAARSLFVGGSGFSLAPFRKYVESVFSASRDFWLYIACFRNTACFPDNTGHQRQG